MGRGNLLLFAGFVFGGALVFGVLFRRGAGVYDALEFLISIVAAFFEIRIRLRSFPLCYFIKFIFEVLVVE